LSAKPGETQEIPEPLPDLPLIEDERGGGLVPKAVQCATYDNAYKAPKCTVDMQVCSSCGLLDGNDNASGYAELNQPNTLYNLCSDQAGTGANSPVRVTSIQVESMSESGFIKPAENIKVIVKAWCKTAAQWIDVLYTQNADMNSPTFTHLGSYRCDCGQSYGWGAPVLAGSNTCSRSGNETTISFLMTLANATGNMAIRARVQHSNSQQTVTCYTASTIYDHDDLVFTVQNPPSFLSTNCAVYDSTWKVPRCNGEVNNCSTCDLVESRDNISLKSEQNTPNAWNSSCLDGTSGKWYSSRSIEEIALTTTASYFSPSFQISVTVRVFCSSAADYVHLYVSAGISPISWSPVGSAQCTGSDRVEDKKFTFTPSVEDWYVIRAVVTDSTASTCPSDVTAEVDDVAVLVLHPPYNLSVTAYSTETINQYVVSFIDNSTNEDGFAIERTSDGVSWTRYEWWSDPTMKAGTGSRTIEFSLSGDVRWCFRVASFKQNAAGTLTLSSWADNATRCVIGVKAPSNLYVESVPVLRTLRFFWQDNSSYESGQNFEWRHSASSSYNQDSVGQNTAYYEKQFQSETVYCFRVTNWWSGDPSKPEEQGSYSQGYSGEVCKHAIGSPYPLYATFSSSGIRLDWQDNATSDVKYLIQVTNGSTWTTALFPELSSNTANYEFNLGASGRYCYRVRVKSGAVQLWTSNVVCVNYGNAACSGVMTPLNVGVGSALKSVLSDGDMVFVAFADKVSGVSKPVVSGGSTTVKWSKTLGSQVSSNICSLSQDRIFIGADSKIYVIRKGDGAILSERVFGSGPVNNGCAVSGG